MDMVRVGQNRIYTPYMTVCMVISLQQYRIYTYIPINIWFWPTLDMVLWIWCYGYGYGMVGEVVTRLTLLEWAKT